jgi:hypothetical protein
MLQVHNFSKVLYIVTLYSKCTRALTFQNIWQTIWRQTWQEAQAQECQHQRTPKECEDRRTASAPASTRARQGRRWLQLVDVPRSSVPPRKSLHTFSKVLYIVPLHSKYTRAQTFENVHMSVRRGRECRAGKPRRRQCQNGRWQMKTLRQVRKRTRSSRPRWPGQVAHVLTSLLLVTRLPAVPPATRCCRHTFLRVLFIVHLYCKYTRALTLENLWQVAHCWAGA